MGLVIQMLNDHSKQLRMLKITKYCVDAIFFGGYLDVVIQYYVVFEFFKCIFSRVDECIFSRDVACMVRNLRIKFCELEIFLAPIFNLYYQIGSFVANMHFTPTLQVLNF